MSSIESAELEDMIVRDGRVAFKDKLMLSPIIDDDSDIEREVGYMKLDKIIEINKRRRHRQSWSHLTKKMVFFTQMKHNNFFGLYEPDVAYDESTISSENEHDVAVDENVGIHLDEVDDPRSLTVRWMQDMRKQLPGIVRPGMELVQEETEQVVKFDEKSGLVIRE